VKRKSTKSSVEASEGAATAGKKRNFPGQKAPGKSPAIRMDIARSPLANMLGHASEFPEVEVCGVLIGDFYQDDQGPWIEVSAIVRGEGAREQGSAVTFTNETWNHIHKELDENHPGKMIVGWYHTHPNFGVFLSEMDTFIHTNFFGHPHHVALVRDPIQGQTAVFLRQGEDMIPLDAYWVDGLPVGLNKPVDAGVPAGSDAILEEIRTLRYAIAAMQSAQDENRQKNWANWAIAFLLALLASIMGFQVYLGWRANRRSQEYIERLFGGKLGSSPGGVRQMFLEVPDGHPVPPAAPVKTPPPGEGQTEGGGK